MKIEQKLENTQQYQSNNPYFVWEQHNVTLIRSKNYGYGIAISGGLCNGHQDPSIYVSDIVPRGPAEHKLYINDKLLSVNGVNIENVEHSFVIRLLKEAKEFIHLVIKRKINDIYNTKDKDIMLKELQNSNNIESQSTIKRCNQAILQTANTILSNFSQNETNNEPINIQNDLTEKITKNQNTIPLLKPIKVTLNRKDKKEGFGIVLGCKYYIKDILTDSLGSHENSNLRKGDILLKMNDITMEQLSLSEAKKILVKSNKLNLSVKRNSLEVNFDDSDDVLSEENISPVSSTNTSPPLPKESVENHILLIPPPLDCTESQKNYQNVPEIPENEHKLSTKQLFKPISNVGSDISTQNRNSKFYSNKNAILNYRTIRFARENGIGIRLAGGNKVGIFICDVQYNSPAERAGLKIADKLIKVNGTDYSTLTREEAVHHILMIQNTIEMVVALSQEEYEQYAFDPLGGDSFYIRTHFNYTSQNHVDLNFQINDILHVTDTLYNGVMGQWVATKLSDSSIQNIAKGGHNNLPQSNEQSRGTIPNQTNAEQIVSSAQTIDQICMSENPIQNPINNLHSIGASARMSIRKKLGKSALAKRSKSASRSNANSDSEETQKPETKLNNTKKIPDNIKVSKANTFCGSKYPAYEKVVLKEVNFTRPVVIFGSLADVARDRLKCDMPNIFAIPDSYSTDSNQNSAGVIKLASIKSIIDKNQHCLLDITPNAVEHLNYAQYFPICVFLKADSHGHVKELRHKYAKNLKLKSSKRLYENSMRLSTYYSHLFTASIQLDSTQWQKKLKEIIESQQHQPLWISRELDDLLNSTQKPETINEFSPSNTNNYDITLQQQKFIAKQNQLMKVQYQNSLQNQQIPQNNHFDNRFNFDDNFELPIYTSQPAQFNGGCVSGAASTYSLYEDQNYRSSFAASDSDICLASNNPNPIANTSSILKNNNSNNLQPIYSTNFNSSQRVMDLNEQLSSTPGNNNNTLTQNYKDEDNSNGQSFQMARFKSESNLINYEQPPSENGQNSNKNWTKKYATFNPNENVHKNALIQKTGHKIGNDYDVQDVQNCQISQNYQNQVPNPPQPPALPPQNPRVINNYSSNGYKLIKNSQSNLMPNMGSAIIDNSMHYADLNEGNMSNSSLVNNTSIPNIPNNRSLLQPISKNISSNDLSLVEKLNHLKMSNELPKQQSNSNMNYYSMNPTQQSKPYINNNNISNNINNQNIEETLPSKRPTSALIKKEPPTKPPPPTLPKPKFNLPQSSVTNLVLQRNLKAKSELNIATPQNMGFLSSSGSSGASSTSSSKDIINTNSPDELETMKNDKDSNSKIHTIEVQHMIAPGNTKLARNKLLENNSLVSSSVGYHSDTWESDNPNNNTSLKMEQNSKNQETSQLTPSRYKQFNHKNTGKLIIESKLAQTTILPKNSDTAGSTSDGSLNGISGDDTDSIPHCYKNNILLDSKKSSSSSASSSASCSSTSSAAALSGATTLSSNSSNSFSAAVQAVIQQNNQKNGEKTGNLCQQILPRAPIELPIYFQTSNSMTNGTQDGEILNKTDDMLNKSNGSVVNAQNNSHNSHNSHNSYNDLYSNANEALKYSRPSGSTYTAHYNDNGVYRKLSLDSNSNCSIIASANGIFDSNGGILESADTGVSINVPEGAIANGYSFDLYFKVCHCKSNITNGKGELLTNPIVMCGPRGVKFLKPIELQIPHFISIDGQSWSYAFKTCDLDDSFNFSRFQKKTLLNSVVVPIDGF